MDERWNRLREKLLSRKKEIKTKKIVVGFDGFIDTVARPIMQTSTKDEPAVYFDTIKQFGEYLITRAEKSCSIELEVLSKKLGGNLPYLAKGAGGLGLDVTCIGMLGDGNIEEPFQNMPCKLYSFAAAGEATALEFNDGKVLLSSDCKLPRDAWQMVTDAVKNENIHRLFEESDLIALVNWSELSFSHKLWQKVFEKSLEYAPCDKEKFTFFDLCDCSRKSAEEINDVLNLIGNFATRRTAILSLNENEAHVVSESVLNNSKDPVEIANQIRKKYKIDEVLVHTIHESMLSTKRGDTRLFTLFVQKPAISTGAGDNFNAASCFGAVMGLSDSERILFANKFAHYYISNGINASLDELK